MKTTQTKKFKDWLLSEYDSTMEELGENNKASVLREYEELTYKATTEDKERIMDNTIRSLNL